MKAWISWVLKHRLAVLGACGLVTLLALASISRSVIATSHGALFFGDSPAFARYQQRVRQFANDEFFAVAYADPAPLSAASLTRLEAIVKRIERRQGVGRVESILDAVRVRLVGGLPVIEKYADAARRDPQQVEALTAELRKDPLARGLLISQDGSHVAVHIELTVDPSRPVERAPALVREAVEQFEASGFRAEQLRLAGLPALFGEIIDQTYFNLLRLLPLAACVLLLVVFAMFRRLAPVTVSMGVAVISVIWCLGLATMIDRNLNIMMSIVPAVVLVVAFSDVIHLWSAYLIELQAGKSRDAAIRDSAGEVGVACLLTSATTFVGFVSLSLVPTPVFRQLGLVLGFGVGVALLLAMTLVPIVLSFFPAPSVAPRGSAPRDWLGAILDRLLGLATGRPWWVIAAFSGLIAASLLGLSKGQIETDFQRRLAADNRFRVDQQFFQKHFAGTNVIEVFLALPADQQLNDPELLARIVAFEATVEALPEVDKVISSMAVLDHISRQLGGRGSAQELAGLMALSRGTAGMGRLVDFEQKVLRVAVRLNSYGMRGTHDVGQAIEQLGEQHLSGINVEVTGLTYLLGWWLDSILIGQRNGLIFSLLVIGLMMIIGTRSIRVGLWSMLPNVLPLLVVAGYVGAAWDQIDSDTLVIGMLGIGIGVDDTIHFLMRFRLEAGRCADTAEALLQTFRFAGRAIVMTTIILVLGFYPFAYSDYFSIRIMGTLLPLVLVVALLADLLLVPALIQVGWIKFVFKDIQQPTT